MKWFIGIAVIVAILAVVAFINRKKAAAALTALEIPGERIKISNGSTVHAVSMGDGKYTFVMLSGWGTASPYADFLPLAEKLCQHARVIILELPGYGFAPVTDAPRNLYNYEAEIRETLQHFRIENNIILMPHSYSGIMTYHYAKKHPDSVCALFNDDASVWHQYYLKTPKGIINLIIGLEKYLILNYGRIPFNNYLKKKIAQESVLSGKHLDMYVTIMQNNILNRTIEEEDKFFTKNMEPYLNTKYDENLYVVNMIAVSEEKEEEMFKSMCGYTWQEAHEDLISNPEIQKIAVMEGAKHYIHHTHADEMEKLAVELIEDLENGRK